MATTLGKQIFLSIGLFLSLACVVFLAVNKGDLVLYFQQMHSPVLDQVFSFVTRLGEELGLVPALVILLWRLPLTLKKKGGVFLKIVACLLGMFLLVVVLKQYVFDFNRPLVFFEEQGVNLLPVDGVRLNRYHSFPSGHTATAFFGWFLVFNLLFPHSRWRNVWFLVAGLVALSRIYLGQHFLQDVWMGAFIGYAWALLAQQWIYVKHPRLKA